MVEVKCRDMIDVVSVIPFVLFSSRLGAFQLLTYCISFISTHLEVVCQLHGREYLPSGELRIAIKHTLPNMLF